MVNAASALWSPSDSPWQSLRILDAVMPIRVELPSRITSLDPQGAAALGVFWKDGALELVGTRRSLRMESWPHPAALHRIGDGQWSPCARAADRVLCLWPRLEPGLNPVADPLGRLCGYRRKLKRSAMLPNLYWPFSLYFDQLPPEVRTEASRLERGRWQLLRLFAGDPRSVELCRSNPALAFILAHAKAFLPGRKRIDREELGELLSSRQTLALSLLGFPGTDSVRRILRKIRTEELSPSLLLRIRAGISDPGVHRILSMVPSIHRGIIDMALDLGLRAQASDRFLIEYASAARADLESGPFATVPRAMRDTAIWLRGIKAGNRFLPFESLGQLDRLHGKCHVAERDRKWERAARAATELFPEAPLPGTGHIVPIRSSAELYREGIEMDNCVPDYLGDALSGYACFYKVLYPVRGTLAIGDKGFYGHSRWVPAAMYGKSNRKIPSEIVHATFEALFQRARGRERLERYLGMEEKPDPELAL